MNEPLDLTKLKLGDKLTIDVVVRFIDIGSDLPLCVDIGDVDDLWLSPTCIKSCNARFTDQSPDTGKTIDHISEPQDMVKPPEIEDVRIATLTAERDELQTIVNQLCASRDNLGELLSNAEKERDAALNRFRENADMKHFVELWEQDQLDYGTAIERAEKAEKELDAALARERELVLDIQALWNGPNDIGTNLHKLIKKIAIGRCYDANGNWKGEVEG